MNKYCYICGKKIINGDKYFDIGGNSYVCESQECYNKYYWDSLAAKIAVDHSYEYAIVGHVVYQIDYSLDTPRGYGGKYWKIRFHDGTIIDTCSLWLCGRLPTWLNFSDNAIFLPH